MANPRYKLRKSVGGKMEQAFSGIDSLGDIGWGSHFCHFYHGQHDLIDTLVPYFKAGLENHEKCLWITSEPLLAHDARALLKNAVPRLEEYEKTNQIEIYNYSDWYLKTGKTDTDGTIQSWVDRQYRALENGFKGLRLTGNTYWLERKDWKGFTEYESKVNQTFSKHRIIGLCSYCLHKTGSIEVFDVVRNHDFALLREKGKWELLETARVKESKDHLQRLNQELKTNLKQARVAAESASRLKTAFLANMSHEIRTPLGAILGFTELLRDKNLSNEDKEIYAETVQRNGKSLLKLVDDILDLSKIEADRLETEKVSFSLPNLINEILSIFTHSVEKKRISLRVEFSHRLPTMLVSDPLRIRQILVNLIGNALKFTEVGEVVVKVDHPGEQGMLRLEVKDTGMGIPAERRENLFQPFMQADGSMTRKFGGTGLGLYLSRRLAQALGGDIFLASSQVGCGTTFVATILAEEDSSRIKHGAPVRKTEGPARALEGLRILTVEDTLDIQLLLRRFLQPTGAKIEFANDGEEGVKRALDEDFDVVLMDLQMPKVDGYEATRTLRKNGFSKPILALTAHAMKEERERTLTSGFDGHISKPIDRLTLIESLCSYRSQGLLVASRK